MEVCGCSGRSFAFPAIASRATQYLWKLGDVFRLKGGFTTKWTILRIAVFDRALGPCSLPSQGQAPGGQAQVSGLFAEALNKVHR